MRVFANLAMLACWSFLTIGVAGAVLSTALGDYAGFYDLFDLPEGAARPATVWMVLTGGLALLALLVLGVIFWCFSRLLRAAGLADFDLLSVWLGRSGGALTLFWAICQVIDRVLPFPLTAHLPADQRPEMDWVPLDLDLILLVLGLVLWTVAGSMRKAAEIARENSQFV